MRVVIVGGGEVGFALAQALSGSHEVFVIDHAPSMAARFEPLDVQFVMGSGTSPEALTRAGAASADALVACTGLDEVNIVTCAMARRLGPVRTMCFVSRQDFLGDDESGLAEFGIDSVIWPEAQLAADMERIIRTPDALDAESFADGAIHLVEYPPRRGVAMAGRRIADLHLPDGALVVAVRRGDQLFIPHGDSGLRAGDKAIVMGTPDALHGVHTRFSGATATGRQRVTILGGGDVGLQLAQRLDSDAHITLTVIERDAQRGELVASRLSPQTLVLTGDGPDLELLESEDIGRSDVLVSVIDNDERNLLTSLLGRQLGVRRIITRVSKRANLRLFERVGIDVAISARGAAVDSVLHQVQGGATRLLAVVEQGAGRILELDVPAGYQRQPLGDLPALLDSIVGAIIRDGRAIVPRGTERSSPAIE